MKTRAALLLVFMLGHGYCALLACGHGSESNGSTKSAEQAGDASDAASCIVPDGADTYDAGNGGLASGCGVGPVGSGCLDHEYLLTCHGGSGVELQAPAPALGCH